MNERLKHRLPLSALFSVKVFPLLEQLLLGRPLQFLGTDIGMCVGLSYDDATMWHIPLPK